MKLIARADDLGFSEGANYGIEKAIKDGIIRSTGMMSNMPYAQHGYELIKHYPDVCVGQHTNICVGKPCAPIDAIPSLVDPETGLFYSSKKIRMRQEDTIVLEEAIIEVEAQLARFIEITGKAPAYFEGHAVFSKNFFRALEAVAKKHKLFYCNPLDQDWCLETGLSCGKWFSADERGLYDPIHYMIDDECEIKGKDCAILIFHPGYLDQFILDTSTFTLIRPLETQALCSKEVKDWVKEQNIQLCNFTNYRN